MRFLYYFLSVVIGTGVVVLWFSLQVSGIPSRTSELSWREISSPIVLPTPSPLRTSSPLKDLPPQDKQESGRIPTYAVPFVSQAPLGSWADNRFQNACEEASLLMAMGWVRGQSYSPQEAERELLAMADFEQVHYGFYEDTSARDTARLMKDYFKHAQVRVEEDITVDDILRGLTEGVVIVPVNGRILMNPYYTPPGPLQHMLVVVGYDSLSNEFITNDSGTRHGKNFRYSKNRLQQSLQDYPSGNHMPITQKRTSMIVVMKERF
jgi:hypothetical protein